MEAGALSVHWKEFLYILFHISKVIEVISFSDPSTDYKIRPVRINIF